MSKRFKHAKYILVGLSVAAVLSAAAMTSYTLAAFKSTHQITQPIALDRQLGYAVYLNPGVWEQDNALFYIYQWNSKHNTGGDDHCWLPSSKKTANGYYVFFLQIGTKNTSASDENCFRSFKFTRINPSASGPSFDDGVCWNESANLSFTIDNSGNVQNNDGNTKNVYHIEGWDSSKESWSETISS